MTCLSYVCLSSPSMLELVCSRGRDKGARMRASPTVHLQAVCKRLLVSCWLISCLPKKVKGLIPEWEGTTRLHGRGCRYREGE